MPDDRLLQLLTRLSRGDGVTQTEWPRLSIAQLSRPMPRTPVVYSASLCFVAQGRKRAYLGDEPFEYNHKNYLICSLPLPIESEICGATPREPMLGVVLKFDPTLVAKLLVEMEELGVAPSDANAVAVAPCPMTERLHASLMRFLTAIIDPLERRVLGANLERELMFEVLRGPGGHVLRHFVSKGGSAHKVARVVSHLEQHYKTPLDLRAVAKQAGMSSSSLHEHFKRATALSPIQFVKRLRLHEARARLMSGHGASEAAFSVGYTSPSQFSREFRRHFGYAPREAAVHSAAE